MIKKYFALSLVTASMVVAGCSSDSNDPVDPPAPTSPAADITNDSSAYDVVANSPDHTSLAAAIAAAGLADTLDDPANTFTIFAPTDAAFAALDEAEAGSVAALLADTDALTRVLQFHVVSGALTGTQISEGVTGATEEAPFTSATLLTDGTLTFTNPEAGLSVNGVVIATADLAPMGEGATGVVHSIGTVLEAPEATEPVDPGPTEPGPTEPTPGAGDVQAALESAGNFGGFLSSFGAAYGLQKLDAETDADPWTVFAPTDAALAGADLVVNDHIATGNKLSPADLLAAGTFTSFNGNSYAVAGTEEALTVGGFAVAVVGEGASITYSIDGVLQ